MAERVTVDDNEGVVVASAKESDQLGFRSEAPALHGLLASSPLKSIAFDEEGVKSPIRGLDAWLSA